MNDLRMHYLVYKITNKRNGMIYIGKHETYNLDDKYMGSGTYLKIAIRKEGIQNFEKEILFDFETRKEMLQKEKELVDLKFIANPNTYNMIEGGISSSRTKTMHWICNDALKIQKYISIDIDLSEYEIENGWRYGQLKKVDTFCIKYKNEQKTIREWAQKFNVDPQLILDRLNLNWETYEIFEIPFEYGKYKISKEERMKKRIVKPSTLKARANRKKKFTEERKKKATRFLEEFKRIGQSAMIQKYGKASYRYISRIIKEFFPEDIKKMISHSTKIKIVTIDGKSMSITKWSQLLNVPKFRFYEKLDKDKTLTIKDVIEMFWLKSKISMTDQSTGC